MPTESHIPLAASLGTKIFGAFGDSVWAIRLMNEIRDPESQLQAFYAAYGASIDETPANVRLSLEVSARQYTMNPNEEHTTCLALDLQKAIALGVIPRPVGELLLANISGGNRAFLTDAKPVAESEMAEAPRPPTPYLYDPLAKQVALLNAVTQPSGEMGA